MDQVGKKRNSLPGTTEEGAAKELPAPQAGKGKTTRKKDFVMVPKSILNNTQLTLQDKWLWITLASCRNSRTGLCYPTIAKICALSTLNKKTVLKSRRKLREMGLISYGPIKGKGHRTQYKLRWFESDSIGVKSPEYWGKKYPKALGEKHPHTPQKKSPETGKDKTITETQKDPNNKNLTIRRTTSGKKNPDDDQGKYPNLDKLDPGILEQVINLELDPDTINTLIDELNIKDINQLFSDCLLYIQNHRNIKNPAAYFITMAKKKANVLEAIQEKKGKAEHTKIIYHKEEQIPSVQDQIKTWEEETATPQQVKPYMDRIRKIFKRR